MFKFACLLLTCGLLPGGGLASPLSAAKYRPETIVIKKKQVVALFNGTVRDKNGAPIKGTRVDVFSEPKEPSENATESKAGQLPLVSTQTSSEGKFRFQRLPEGKYEVRFSAAGFNDLRMFIEIKPKSGKYKGIEVVLAAAT